MSTQLDDIITTPLPQAPAVLAQVFFPETPFGAVQIIGATEPPIQIEIDSGSAVQSVFGRVGAVVAQASDYAAFYAPLGAAGAVTSVFGRTGAITAAEGDYDAFYPHMSYVYDDPSWIGLLSWGKITGRPTTLAGYGITDPVVLSTGSYSDPSWISSLSWAKITGAPPFETALTFTDSLSRNGNVVTLTNDTLTTPGMGSNYFYGFNTAGNRGFTLLPPAEAPLGNPINNGDILSSTIAGIRAWITPNYEVPLSFALSIQRTGNTVQLIGDAVGTPVNSYYGTNNIGQKGFFPLIATGLFEPALGNPSTDGYILSSTAAGVRSWIAPGGGGGGTPGGANTQVQFNNNGAFGGSANFLWDNTNNVLRLNPVNAGTSSLSLTATANLNTGMAFSNDAPLSFFVSGQPTMALYYTSLRMDSTANIGWSVRTNWQIYPTPDTYMTRQAAGVLQITNDLRVRNVTLSGAITGSGSVPAGGTASQALVKNSATDYDYSWATISGGGGEPPLGNPPANGYLLSSTTAGVRSWVAPSGGTVASVSVSSDLSPLFSTAIATPTTTPAFAFTLLSAPGASFFGNSSSAAGVPAWRAAAAITRTNDTNVTLTLGGSPTLALINAVSLTLGWQGTLAVARGGTGAASALAALQNLGGEPALGNPGTDGYILSSTASGVRSWIPVSAGWTPPATVAANTFFGNNTGAAAAPNWYQLSASNLSNGVTGTGSVALSASPTFTGTAVFATINPTTISGPVSITRPVTIQGVNDTSSAASGNVGETIVATRASTLGITMGANANVNILNMTLGAGDWDLRGAAGMFATLPAGTLSQLSATISTTSATINDDGYQSYNLISNSTTGSLTPYASCVLPPRRISLSAGTIIYLVGRTSVAGNGFGYLEARRVR